MVYFVQDETGPVKIGWTRNLIRRLSQLNTSNPRRLRILGVTGGQEREERRIHSRFRHLRIKNEWFRNDKELLDFIESLVDEPKNRSICWVR